ncbi:MAG: hypothetical protein ACK5CE_19940 [Actinomycetes bacterium]
MRSSGRRGRLTLLWLVAVVGWSLVRSAAVRQWLADHGVDPVVYLMVDLSSSIPYALCSASLLGALYDGRRRAALGWAVPTVLAFVAPDVYLLSSGRSLPWPTYLVVLTVAAISATLAVRAGRASLEQRRRAELVTVAVPTHGPSPRSGG